MDYMGFYDLFDHLLETKSTQNKHTSAAKASSVPRSRSSKQPGMAIDHRKTALQTRRAHHALKSKGEKPPYDSAHCEYLGARHHRLNCSCRGEQVFGTPKSQNFVPSFFNLFQKYTLSFS